MRRHQPTGWNTWDFRGFNRLVRLEQGRTALSLMYAVWDEATPAPSPDSKQVGRLYDAFRWTDVTRLGVHGALGLPASLEFKAGDVVYRAEATAEGDGLSLTVTPLATTRRRVVFIFTAPVGETTEPNSAVAGRFGQWLVSGEGAAWPSDYFLNIAEPYLVGEAGKPATLRLRAAHAISGTRERPIEETAGGGRATPTPIGQPAGGGRATSTLTLQAAGGGRTTEWSGPLCPPTESAELRGGGALADAPQAMMQALAWNTLFDSRRRLLCSPVSRDWCVDWRGVIVFGWDTFFAGLMASAQSPELARLNFESVLAGVDELGFVPNYTMAHGATSRDRSQPPIGGYTIWKTQAAEPDRAWLAEAYPRLRRWIEWYAVNRNGNGTGLLAWGSNAEPHYEFPQLVPYNPTLRHSDRAAKWESGLDNSPMYDDVPFDAKACTLELDDVGLSSYVAAEYEALARIADALDRPDDAAKHRADHAAMAQRINGLLWDEANGIYCNRHRDGRLSCRWSPTSFFPLMASVAPPERAERLVREHLLNEREFWGEFVISSIARSDPAFGDNDYWRGRIWGPFNFLVAEGLRRYRFDAEAAELARRGLEMFLRNWRDDGAIYENYNATTGAGGDVWNAARLYHWGGLLAWVAMGELIDVEPAGALRFGSLQFPNASVHNVRAGGSVYDVEIAEGVSVRRDGAALLECSTRAIVRIPFDSAADQPIHISASKGGVLTLHGVGARQRDASLSETRRLLPARSTSGSIRYEW